MKYLTEYTEATEKDDVLFSASPKRKNLNSAISANSSEAGERQKILKELYLSQSAQSAQRKTKK